MIRKAGGPISTPDEESAFRIACKDANNATDLLVPKGGGKGGGFLWRNASCDY